MEKYINLKAPYKRQSSGGKQDVKSSSTSSTPSKGGKPKATLKAGHEYIRGITGSSALASNNYSTMNNKMNTNKSSTGTYGRSNTLGKSHSFLSGVIGGSNKNNNNNSNTLGKKNSILGGGGGSKSSSASTGRRSIFSLRKK